MNCAKCGYEMADGSTACVQCGAMLVLACPACGHINASDNRVCAECGHSLDTEVEEITSSASVKGERRHVTVLFSDLTDYTAISERIDAEEVSEMMSRIFGEISEIVTNYGGVIEQFVGDGILAVFGMPTAHEDDAARAVQAAKEIHDAVEALNVTYEERVGRRLSMHSGINSGVVVTSPANVGGGRTRVLAAKLSEMAKDREILVGAETYRLTAPFFTFEALPPIRVQGKTKPVQAYRLRELKETSREVRFLSALGMSSPLVGRSREFEIVKGCVERLSHGEGSLISILGDAGIGKSRLMAEIRACVSSTNGKRSQRYLEGRAVSFGRTISYLPFQCILWDFAGITEDDTDVRAWQKLEKKVRWLFAEDTPSIVPYLATLLNLKVRGEYSERVKFLDAEALRRQVFLASRRFFGRLAQVEPLMLVFEDLQWMDDSSARLLEHLLPLVERAPLLICGISRRDPESPAIRLCQSAAALYPNRYTEIQLSPLSQQESLHLLCNLLRTEIHSSDLCELIVPKAEGNPFFLEEIIRSLVEAGKVVRKEGNGRWRLTGHIEATTIPSTIQGTIMARVDRLDEDVKRVLRMASVIGRSFFYRVLAAVAAPTAVRVDQHLEMLQAVELIREKQRQPELEYMFRHTLTQEAVYESTLMSSRRRLHARVGEAVERLFKDRLEEFYPLLAYHYARAEVWGMAQKYLLKAGDQAGRAAADAEGLKHYRDAIEAYSRAFGDEWDPLLRASLERKMGEALFRRGERGQALECFERALRYLGKRLPKSSWRTRAAIVIEMVKHVTHRVASKARTSPRSSMTPSEAEAEEEFYTLFAVGWIAAFANQERFLWVALKLLNSSERRGFSTGVARGYMALGTISDLLGLFRLSTRYHRRAVALADELGDPGLAVVYLGQLFHRTCLGEWQKAIAQASRVAALYQQIGDLHGRGFSTYLGAASLAYLGEVEEALKQCEEVVQIGEDASDPQVWYWGLLMRGFILRQLGKWDEALSALDQARSQADATQDYRGRIWVRAELGRCWFHQGKLEQAFDALHEGRRLLEERKISMTTRPFWNAQVEVYLLAAQQREGRERTDWLKKAARYSRRAVKQGTIYRPVMPEAARLKGTYKWLTGKRASARKWWEWSLKLAESLGQRYDSGATLLEMGLRLREQEYLERGKVILSEIGAHSYIDHACSADPGE